MLEIHEAKNINAYRSVIDTLPSGREYKIIESYSPDGSVTGSGIYTFENDSVIICDCRYGDDIDLCDGILRTILFKAMLKGVDTGKCEAYVAEKNLFDVMKYPHLNYTIESIDNFLNSCKKCKEM